MNATPEQFSAQQQATFAIALNTVHILVGAAERLLRLNLATVRQTVGDSAKTARAMIEAKDLQDVNAAAMQGPSLDALLNYSKSLYEIAADTQADLHKLVQARLDELNREFVAQLRQVSKTAPAGSEAVVAMLENSVAAANSAYDTLSKAARQANAGNDTHVASATGATTRGTKRKTGKA
jgi:phasin family protein